MDAKKATTLLCLICYIMISSAVILHNKWILSPQYFDFPFPATLALIQMAFQAYVTFILVQKGKVVPSNQLKFKIYGLNALRLGLSVAFNLLFGNIPYVYFSVQSIQMLKALMPAAVYPVGAAPLGFFSCTLWSVGVILFLSREINFISVVMLFQLFAINTEAYSLLLTWFLTSKRAFNVVSCLYYTTPISLTVLFVACFFELDWAMILPLYRNKWIVCIFFTNATCTLALRCTSYSIIKRTSLRTYHIAGVVRDCIVAALSIFLLPEPQIAQHRAIDYASAVGYYAAILWYEYRNNRRGKSTRRTKDTKKRGI